MNSSQSLIRLDRDGAIATLTFDRPEKLNALTGEMSRDLLRLIREISDDETLRVAILTGAGRAFCVGGDLSLEDSFTGQGFQRELELYAETVLAILSCPKPIICQLNGDAVGWGATIALFCDVIVARSGARLGDPHVSVGLSTGDGASVIWPHLVGHARAKQFLLTGELVTVDAAERFGLVNEVVGAEQLVSRVREIASVIASKPPLAVAMTKASINIALKELVRSSMDTYIAYELATQQHPDHLAAVNAFLDSRKKT